MYVGRVMVGSAVDGSSRTVRLTCPDPPRQTLEEIGCMRLTETRQVSQTTLFSKRTDLVWYDGEWTVPSLLSVREHDRSAILHSAKTYRAQLRCYRKRSRVWPRLERMKRLQNKRGAVHAGNKRRFDLLSAFALYGV